MPGPTSANDLGWQRFWFAIDHDIETYHLPINAKKYAFRPGEVAYAKGVVRTDFYDFLLRKDYTLTEDERYTIKHCHGKTFSKTGKPVVVLRRLGRGRYIVCRMSSWGGQFQIADLFSPVQRYFAFSMSAFIDEWPPGTKYLRFSPPVRKGMAVMALMVESHSVESLGWFCRAFLSIGQIERLEGMVRRREQDFHKVAEKLRESEVKIQKLKSLPFHKWPEDMRKSFSRTQNANPFDSEAPWLQDFPKPFRVGYKQSPFLRNPNEELVKYRDKDAPRLPVPKLTNLLNWMYSRSHDDLVDCDIHVDLEPGHNVDHEARYIVPRVVLDQKEEPAKSRSKKRRPFRKPQICPSLRPGSARVRTFCTTASLCTGMLWFPPPMPFG